mmetsp:Transcript_86085/g.208578  ORF Transcript_86085/g.208578 Transcript_86085/m.208578 type:complete len:515 (-) Transcript_86085:74-1618(-)
MGASGSEPLREPLKEEEEAEEDPTPSCPRLVVGPVVVYYVVAFGIAAGVCYGLYYRHFLMHHIVKELPGYLYAAPYMVLAVTAAALATCNSCHHFYQHLAYNKNGWALKVTILTILSMVPVYAVCSAVALVSNMNKFKFAILLNSFREFYEAMVLIAFMQFIAEFWGGTLRLARTLDTDDLNLSTVFPTPVKKLDGMLGGCLGFDLAEVSIFPFRRAPGSEYVAWTYVGALQYAAVMMAFVLANVAMWVMVLRGQLEEASMDMYLQVFKKVKAASNVWAMFNLFILFEYLRECKNTEARMNRIRPFSKFLCIKLIVIFSLWQEVIMTTLAANSLLPILRGWDVEWDNQKATGEGAVNFLVCLEMLVFAQWHRYAYPYEEDWSGGEEAIGSLRVVDYQPCCCFCRWGVGKMIDDVGYLLCNRIPGQHKCMRLLKQRHNGKQVDIGEGSELARNFAYFELDANGEASGAQLRHILLRSGCAKSMENAFEMLRRADVDANGRLSYKEFTTRLVVAQT